MSAGYVYTTIYLKLMLKSLKNNGSLFFEGIEDDFVTELAYDIDENPEEVQIVFDFLKRKNLLIEVAEDEVSLPGAVQRMGSKTQSAVRMERMRKKQKEGTNVTMSRDNVTMLRGSYAPTEHGCVEIEKSIEENIYSQSQIKEESKNNQK